MKGLYCLLRCVQLPHFLPSRFDMKESGRACDAPKDLMAGDGRAETQVSRDGPATHPRTSWPSTAGSKLRLA